jgi:glycosyltransferase AglD
VIETQQPNSSSLLTNRGQLLATCAAPVALLLVALALRWPYVSLIPRFTDETLEVLHAAAIARGELLPLTNYDSYYGALFNYLIGVPMALVGTDPLLPRWIVMVLGALTVVPTYLLGREIAGRNVGMIAGLLVATGSAHIAVNSHIAWSNCLTPLFTTACFWLLARSQRRSSGPALVGAALLFGLALQTHPAVIAFAPAMTVFVLWRCRRAVSWRWMAVAAGAFLVGYANMVAYNLSTSFDSLRSAQRVSGEYATAEDADVGLQLLSSMLLLLARLAGGAVDQRSGALGYLLDPGVLVSLTLAGVGLVVLWRRGEPLPLLAALTFLALLPLVNTKFRTLITIRYLMPVYSLLALGIAVAVVNLAQKLGTQSARLGLTVAMVALVATIAPSLLSLQRHYDRLLRTSDTNERILRLRDAIHQTRRPDELVIVDEDMGSEIPGTGVTEIRGFRYLLTMDEVPFRSERIAARRLEDAVEADPSVLAVLNGRDLEQAERRLKVQPLESRERAVVGRGSDYQLYRLERQ